MGASGRLGLVTLAAFLLSLSSFGAPGTELVVCPDCELKTIVGAIEAAPAGSRIRVRDGIYHENNILIQKPLRLVGEAEGPKPVVDGGGEGNIFLVTAPNVEISGLEIRGSGYSDIEDLAGIKVSNAAGCRITNNTLKENTFGIFLARSGNCHIEGNYASSRLSRGSPAGNGIHIWNGERIMVLGNRLENNRDGIYFEFVKNSRILDNRSSGNFRYGLHFMFSNDDEYRDNVFSDNGSGVAVMYSQNIQMVNNRFENSLGASSYGILLKDIGGSQVRGNTFRNNTVGAVLDGTTRSGFHGNLFDGNGWAIRVLGNSETNVFTGNDFTGNTFEVATNSRSGENRFERNYWSGYSGIDLDKDGTGDTPYHPVRLSILLMERYGVSVLLMKSFFFSVLDQAESAFPVLTPEAIRDESPLMKPVRARL